MKVRASTLSRDQLTRGRERQQSAGCREMWLHVQSTRGPVQPGRGGSRGRGLHPASLSMPEGLSELQSERNLEANYELGKLLSRVRERPMEAYTLYFFLFSIR